MEKIIYIGNYKGVKMFLNKRDEMIEFVIDRIRHGAKRIREVWKMIDDLEWEDRGGLGFIEDTYELDSCRTTKINKKTGEFYYTILEGKHKGKEYSSEKREFIVQNAHNEKLYKEIKGLNPKDKYYKSKVKYRLKKLEKTPKKEKKYK